jgi:hypothetical protein
MAASGAPFAPDTQGAGIATDEPAAVEDEGGAPGSGAGDSKHVTASTPDELALFKTHAQVCEQSQQQCTRAQQLQQAGVCLAFLRTRVTYGCQTP